MKEPKIEPFLFDPSAPSRQLGRSRRERKPIESETKPELVAAYLLFRQKLNPKAEVVYNPCCANDASPSVVFPDSRVVYVDKDTKSVEALKGSGFEAHAASALDFNPGAVDILIMINPQISPDVPSSFVVLGGFVVCNNYHGTAVSISNNEQFKLQALIAKDSDKKLIYDNENLDDCWKRVDSDEELKGFSNFWFQAQSVVEEVTGKRDNIVAEYKKIIEAAKEQDRETNAQLISKNPAYAEFLEDTDEKEFLFYNYGGKKFQLTAKLPRKKGRIDDIFIFQRN